MGESVCKWKRATQKLDWSKYLERIRILKDITWMWLNLSLLSVANFGFIRFVWPCLDDSDDICDLSQVIVYKMSQEFLTALAVARIATVYHWLDCFFFRSQPVHVKIGQKYVGPYFPPYNPATLWFYCQANSKAASAKVGQVFPYRLLVTLITIVCYFLCGLIHYKVDVIVWKIQFSWGWCQVLSVVHKVFGCPPEVPPTKRVNFP